jgi:ABC-type bacteriocin/lantibiotic exporter with double-glycine peptidase domain
MKLAIARSLDRTARYVCLGCAVLWLAAIAAAGSAGTWLDVPFIAQPENGCGAASAAMVMQYWDNDLHRAHSARSDVETIQRSLYSKQAKGIFASELEGYFKNSGYRAFAIRGEWQDLQQNIRKGRPLIVSLAPSGPRHPLHYVVVAGIDADGEAVFINDPAQQKLLRVPRADFEKEWNDAGNWTLLALPN